MPPPTTNPNTASSSLRWQAEGGLQVTTEGPCYYMREGVWSLLSGFVVTMAIAVVGGVAGGWLLLTDPTVGGRVFAVFVWIIAAGSGFVLVSTVRRGRWMVVYDRGQPGSPGEIRYRRERLSVERVRSISIRLAGSSSRMPLRMVVANLHDGTYEVLGPSSPSTWPDHFGKQAASWMGLPFSHSTN